MTQEIVPIKLSKWSKEMLSNIRQGSHIELVIRDSICISTPETAYTNALFCCLAVRRLSDVITFDGFDHQLTGKSDGSYEIAAFHLYGWVEDFEKLNEELTKIRDCLYTEPSSEWCDDWWDDSQNLMVDLIDERHEDECWPLIDLFNVALAEHLIYCLQSDELSEDQKSEVTSKLFTLRPELQNSELG